MKSIFDAKRLRKRIVGKDHAQAGRKCWENGRRLVDGIRWKLANWLSTRITGPFNISVRYYGERGSKELETKIIQGAPSMTGFRTLEEITLFESFSCSPGDIQGTLQFSKIQLVALDLQFPFIIFSSYI